MSESKLEVAIRTAPQRSGAPEVSIVIPTLNERENVSPLLKRLEVALSGTSYEVIFVDDDSKDGTADLVREIGRNNAFIRVIHRVGRRGLASAVLEGMGASCAPYLAVMDADLQHDEAILPSMLDKIRSGQYDLVIASRNVEGGSMGEFSRERQKLSHFGLAVSKLVSKHELSDAMSGYFVVTRAFYDRVAGRVSGIGFKILLDLVASSPNRVRFTEVGYTFRARQHGESKLDINTAVEYALLIADKFVGYWVPPRFVLFCLVGAIGVLVHFAVLSALYRAAGVSFSTALIAGIAAAVVANFFVNNWVTYRDRRLRAWRLLYGLLLFGVICSFGSLANYALVEFLRVRSVWWPLAAFCGLVIGSVWNFAVSSVLTWPKPRS